MRGRVAALRAGEIVPQDSAVAVLGVDRKLPEFHGCFADRSRDTTPTLTPTSLQHRRGGFSESRSDGEGASEESGAELGRRDDTRVRQVVMSK